MRYSTKTVLTPVLIFILLNGVIAGIFISFCAKKNSPPRPVLTLLTYSSFAGVYGPGRRLKEIFEKDCRCQVRFLPAEDSTGLIQLLGLKVPVDIVIGLDQISLSSAKKFSWKAPDISLEKFLPEVRPFYSPLFVPFDWAPVGWIYKDPRFQGIKSFSDLLSLSPGTAKISFPEPETSTLGLTLSYWLYTTAKGDLTRFKKLSAKLKKMADGPVSSWSLAYGLFRKGRVEMSLSYLTSLIYHRREEGDFSPRFAYFEKGHPYQVEYTAVPETCRECSLALRFVNFLLKPQAQKILMESHFMFPVVSKAQTEMFSRLKAPPAISYKSLPEFLRNKEKILKIWKKTD